MDTGSFYIELTGDEIDHAYLAVCHAIKNNTNIEAVKTFESILSRLHPYVSDETRMTGSMMKQF